MCEKKKGKCFRDLHCAAKSLIIFQWLFLSISVLIIASLIIMGKTDNIKETYDILILNVIVFTGKITHDTFIKHAKEKNGHSNNGKD